MLVVLASAFMILCCINVALIALTNLLYRSIVRDTLKYRLQTRPGRY